MTSAARPFGRRILLNTASTAVANVWAIVVAVVTLPLLLDGLGVTAFGTWVLLQTFSAITGWLSLVDLGVGTAATREVAQRAALDDRTGVGAAVASAVALFLALGVLCAGALAAIGPAVLPGLFHTPSRLHADLRFAVVVFSVQVIVDLLTEGVEACLEGMQRVDLSRLADGTRRTVVAVACCTVALGGGGLRGVAVASALASVAGAATAVGLLAATLRRAAVGRSGLAPSWGVTVALLRYGRTVAVLRPLGVLHRTMDRVIAGVVFGPAAVALVEIATQVQNGADAILSASSYAVVPSASWLDARGDRDALRQLVERGTRYSLLVTAPVIAVTAMLIHPLLRVWIGGPSRGAAGLSVVALLYVAVTAPMQVGSNLLLGTGRAGAILRAALAAVVLNLAASIVLVHVIGIVGVFAGTLVGSVALVPMLGRAVVEHVETSGRELLRVGVLPAIPPTVAAIAVCAAVRLAGLDDALTLVLGVGAAVAVYILAALRWAVPAAELRELRRVVTRRGGEGEAR